MKTKFAIILLFILCTSFFLSRVVLAGDRSIADEIMDQVQAGGNVLGAGGDPRLVAVGIVQIILGVTGMLFMALIFMGGYLMVTANGEEEKVKKGMNIIKTAVVGIVIILLSYSITLLIGNKITSAVVAGNEKSLTE